VFLCVCVCMCVYMCMWCACVCMCGVYMCVVCEFKQILRDGEGQGSWHTAILGSQRVRHDLEIEQQCY